MKKFCHPQVSVVTFSGGVGNNTVKNDFFWISEGKNGYT